MANTQMDNYIDSLEKGQEIEYEGEKFVFDRFVPSFIVCKCYKHIMINDFHEDLEFGENKLFQKYCSDEKEDEQQEAGILNSKQENDV